MENLSLSWCLMPLGLSFNVRNQKKICLVKDIECTKEVEMCFNFFNCSRNALNIVKIRIKKLWFWRRIRPSIKFPMLYIYIYLILLNFVNFRFKKPTDDYLLRKLLKFHKFQSVMIRCFLLEKKNINKWNFYCCTCQSKNFFKHNF